MMGSMSAATSTPLSRSLFEEVCRIEAGIASKREALIEATKDNQGALHLYDTLAAIAEYEAFLLVYKNAGAVLTYGEDLRHWLLEQALGTSQEAWARQSGGVRCLIAEARRSALRQLHVMVEEYS
jgi:hypothetical protein